MKTHTLLVLCVLSLAVQAAPEVVDSKAGRSAAPANAPVFRAGAHAQDISPTKFPAPVNGGMKGAFAQEINDPMHARCLALHDGKNALVFAIVDACLLPREVAEEAKEIASRETGVPKTQMLVSATHTHSAAALTPAFQSDPDPDYVKTVGPNIARGIIQALKNLEPAELGWAFGSDPVHVFNRRWHIKDGEVFENPFGQTTDRVKMNPGVGSLKVSVPSGPVDQDVAVLAVRSAADKRPIGLLANYSLHYVGGNRAISADYFGAFAAEIASRLGASGERYAGKPAFVGIMSNGTSGNINAINFGTLPPRNRRDAAENLKTVARVVADTAQEAYEVIQWQADVKLDSEEVDLQLGVRKGSPQELVQAREWLETIPKDKDGQWSNAKAIYARETVKLADYPDTVPVKIQMHRVNGLSIGAIPCEVFVEIGLHLKKVSPFTRHFTISLANGYNGYLPTPQHHEWGGYETWRARSSYLETQASPKIVERMEKMFAVLRAREK
jgi:neutral ceramidase